LATKDEKEVRGDRANIETGDVHKLYQDLSRRSAKNPEQEPFLSMKDVFMWAVVLRVRAGKKRPLATGRTQPFRWNQLSQDMDIPALKAIAVADTGDVEIILHKDRILRIAEEYANAGIRELKRELVDQPGQPLWNLVNLIRDTQVD